MEIWADLVELGFGNFLDQFTLQEMYELWITRMNKKGFSYEVDLGGKKESRQIPIYYYKKK